MICFPNAKINLGLNIIEKRTDGFHNIESVFYPIHGLKDALEVIENFDDNKDEFVSYGIDIPGSSEDNLCLKALQLVRQKRDFPWVKIILQKHIPIGAGLGGGSSDASFCIKLLNDKFELGLITEEMIAMAAQLGSDCAFFIKNETAYATQKGEMLAPVSVELSQYRFVLIFSSIHISTKEAYQGIVPSKTNVQLLELLQQPVETWKESMKNDFESTVFQMHPQLKETKDWLYEQGAVYASMTGTGSTVYGIFNRRTDTVSLMKKSRFEHYYIS